MKKFILVLILPLLTAWQPNKTFTTMKNRNIERVIHAQSFRMGEMTVKQPLPVRGLNMVGLFVLLHHAVPKEIKAGSQNFE
jgi:hypothetical protein